METMIPRDGKNVYEKLDTGSWMRLPEDEASFPDPGTPVYCRSESSCYGEEVDVMEILSHAL